MPKRKAPNATPIEEPPLKTRHTQLDTEIQSEVSFQWSPSSILSLETELDPSLRVLRAMEEIENTDGNIVKVTEDFLVPISLVSK